MLLPDSVLLEIFDFCRMDHDAHGFPFPPILQWRTLVHVCQRWRLIIFASPLRLDLQLLCTHGTPVKKNLDTWPPLPLIIDYYTFWDDGKSPTLSEEEDVITALNHPDRVRYVGISVTNSLLGKMAAAMQEPFPMLTHLWLSSKDGNVPVLPGSFLGGFTPRLRVAHLEGIPFPSLPTLLLSATDLVDLQILNIPKIGYVSPEAMVAGLAALTRLETLSIGFQSATPRPDRVFLPPLARVVFPSLTAFNFRGVSEYLEDLVARIDTPLFTNVTIMYFNQLIFRIPRLSQFISRTGSLDLARFKHARVDFGESHVCVSLYEEVDQPGESRFALQISCQCLDWQISHMSQVLDQSSVALSHVGDLSIDGRDLHPGWRADDDSLVEPSEWRGLLCPFIGVEKLRVSKQLAGHVALALEDITMENVAEMLPALHSLFLEDQPEASVERYIGARQISGRPVNVSKDETCSTPGDKSKHECSPRLNASACPIPNISD
jgi:hypothetical protein